MAVTRDQTATGQAVASVSTVTFTWATNPTPGSKVLIYLSSVSQAVSSAVDNGTTPATFTADIALAPGVSSGKYLLRADNITLPSSGSYHVTVTLAGTTSFLTGGGRSYLGVSAGPPVATSTSSTGTSSSVVTGNVTPPSAGALLIGGFTDASSVSETITLTTSGANAIFTETDGVNFFAGAFADNIVTTTSAQGLAWTLSDSPSWGATCALYPQAATGSAGMHAMALSATGTVTTGPTGTASFALASLGLSAAAIEVITSSAAFQMSPMALSGSGGPLVNVTSSGSLGMAPMSFSGIGGPLTPASGSGTLGMAPMALHASAPAGAFDVAPASPPLPSAPLDARLEFQRRTSGSPWLDVSQRVFYDTAIYQRGGQDESTQTSPAMLTGTLDNHDGVLSDLNPMSPYYGQLGMNTPTRLSVPNGSTYMRLEGQGTDMAATPSSVALNPSGDFEVWLDADLDNWYSNQVLCGKYSTSAGQRSWFLVSQASGVIQLIMPDSASAPTVYRGWSSSAPSPIVHGRQSIRLKYAAATGTAFFYTGVRCASWTSLGPTGTTYGTAISAPSSTSDLQVGWVSDQSDFPQYSTGILGKVYAFALVSGNNNPISSALAYADFTQVGAGITSFSDAPGNAWSIFNAASVSDREYLFHGEADAWPQSWTVGDANARVSLSAGGLLRRYSQVSATANSAMRRAYTRALASGSSTAPIDYWPFEEATGATQLASGLSGGTSFYASPAVNVGSSQDFACSAGLPVMNGGWITGSIPSYTPGTGSGSGGTIFRWLQAFSPTVETASTVMVSMYFGGGGPVGRVDLVYNSLNAITANTYDLSGSLLNTTGAFAMPTLIAGAPWHGRMSIEYLQSGASGSQVQLVFSEVGAAGFVETLYTASSGGHGSLTRVVFNPGGGLQNMAFGHLSLQTQWTSLFDMLQPLQAWVSEAAGVRFQRICSEEGIAFRSIGNLSATQKMGPQTLQTLSALLQECADADRGIWYETKQVLGWGYRTRASLANQLAAVTFDYALDHLSGSLDPTTDDQVMKNDVTVSSSTGGSSSRSVLTGAANKNSVDNVGRHDTSVSVNVDNSQLSQLSGWLLWVLSCPDVRHRQIQCDLANAALGSSLYYAILQMEVGDRLQIIHPPAWLPPTLVDQLVKGIRGTVSEKALFMSWNGIPCLPWNVAIFNDATYGRFASDGSMLSAGVTSAATSLSVATTNAGSPLWTTSGGDFPFYIQAGGEQMQVTAITGSSSPQTFTVVRSVNGVVKTHSSGDYVSLYTTPVVSL